MAQLKVVSSRLKSIKNIQKITKTMKMVSASKFTRAERELRAARPFGYAPRKFYSSTGLTEDDDDDDEVDDKKQKPAATDVTAKPPVDQTKEKEEMRLYIAVTSDRGLCGGVHSGVCRRIRGVVAQRGAEPERARLVCLGDKARSMLRRILGPNMLLSAKEIGRVSPVFGDASLAASAVTGAGYKYSIGEIYYNKFISAIKYELSVVPFFDQAKIEAAPKLFAFEVESEEIESYAEWTLAALLYYAMKESACAEQSARMAAMDNATKNAAEMIRKLTLLYNRTRQAVITRELIEIISGAAALK